MNKKLETVVVTGLIILSLLLLMGLSFAAAEPVGAVDIGHFQGHYFLGISVFPEVLSSFFQRHYFEYWSLELD